MKVSIPTVSEAVLLRLSFVVLLVHQTEMLTRTPAAFIGICFALLGILWGEERLKATATGVALVGVVEVLWMPWNVPNHLVVATLWAVAMALSHGWPAGDRVRLRSDQAVWLLGVVFVFATLQKLTSPFWMNGSYPALLVQMGGFGHDLLVHTSLGEVIEGNRRVHDWAQTGREFGPVVGVPGGSLATWLLVVGTLAIEAAIVALLFVSRRFPSWLGASVGIFVVATAAMRAEFVFLSLVSMLTAWVLADRPRWRTFFVFLSSALMLVWIGFRRIQF